MCVFAGIGNWKVWRMLSQNIWIDHSKTLTFIFSASPQFPSIFCTFFRSIFAVLFSRFLFDISHYPYNSIICKKTYAKLRGKKSCFVIDHSVDFPTGIQNFHPKWQKKKNNFSYIHWTKSFVACDIPIFAYEYIRVGTQNESKFPKKKSEQGNKKKKRKKEKQRKNMNMFRKSFRRNSKQNDFGCSI